MELYKNASLNASTPPLAFELEHLSAFEMTAAERRFSNEKSQYSW